MGRGWVRWNRFSAGVDKLCSGLSQASWLLALIAVPLYFNLFSKQVFEADKLAVLRALLVASGAAWGVRLFSRAAARPLSALRGIVAHLRTPLVVPSLCLAASFLLSSFFSVEPRLSWFGSQFRARGTLTTLSLLLLFFVLLHNLDQAAKLRRIWLAILLASVPISLYGILQFSGLDPLPWGKFFEGGRGLRIISTQGNPIFLGAYLLTPIFLALGLTFHQFRWGARDSRWRQIGSGLLAVCLLILNLTALLLTASRGPGLGFLAGCSLFVILASAASSKGPIAGRRKVAHLVAPVVCSLTLLAVLGLTVLFLVRVPAAYSQLLHTNEIDRDVPPTLFVRVLIWDAAMKLMTGPGVVHFSDGSEDALAAYRPWIGFGPETVAGVLLSQYPPKLVQFGRRRDRPDHAHNLIVQDLITRGWLGVSVFLFFFICVLVQGLEYLGLIPGRSQRWILLLGLMAGGLGGGISALIWLPWMLGLGVSLGLVLALCSYLLWFSLRQAGGHFKSARAHDWFLTAILAALWAQFIEQQSGLGTAAGILHFWVLSALVVVVGEGRGKWTTIQEAEGSLNTFRQRERAGILSDALLIAFALVTLGFDFFGQWDRSNSLIAAAWAELTGSDSVSPLFRPSNLLLILFLTWAAGILLAYLWNQDLRRRWSRPERLKQFFFLAIGSLLTFYLCLSAQLALSVGSIRQGPMGGSIFESRVAPYSLYWLVLLLFLAILAPVLSLQARKRAGRATLVAPMGAIIAGLLVFRFWRLEAAEVARDVVLKQGQTLSLQGRFEDAYLVFQQLDIAGTKNLGIHLLAWSESEFRYATQLDSSQREDVLRSAQRHLQSAIRLRPLDIAPLEELARVEQLRAEGTASKEEQALLLSHALESLGKALQMAPARGYVHYETAQVLRQMGRNEEARQALAVAFRLDPTLQRVIKGLESDPGDPNSR